LATCQQAADPRSRPVPDRAPPGLRPASAPRSAPGPRQTCPGRYDPVIRTRFCHTVSARRRRADTISARRRGISDRKAEGRRRGRGGIPLALQPRREGGPHGRPIDCPRGFW